MKDFAGRIAVVTDGGIGMGRELVRQLVAEGCNVAMCDVLADAMAETKRLCEADRPPQGLRITTHIADISNEAQVQRFRDNVAAQQETEKIHLLFNNAGIGGGGSMIASSREEWEKTFNVCWEASIATRGPSWRCCNELTRATSSIRAASTASGHPSDRAFHTPPLPPPNSQ
jgi:NAD(P)-dependent dehydrogenase (short-subunit alcohol dehydrogenase family)